MMGKKAGVDSGGRDIEDQHWKEEDQEILSCLNGRVISHSFPVFFTVRKPLN